MRVLLHNEVKMYYILLRYYIAVDTVPKNSIVLICYPFTFHRMGLIPYSIKSTSSIS